MIEYRITVDDPVTFTAPFTVRAMWTTQPNYEVYEYSCHEGNFFVASALRAEQEYQRRVAEAKANGFDVKALRTIVRMRKMEATEREEQEAILETYLHALGMLKN